MLGIHRDYFAAGADIATTNTFTATSIGQADYGLEEHVYEMNLAGARLARQAADEVGGFVAGTLGPLNVTLSLSPRVEDAAFRAVTFDQVRDAYAEQIAALADGGVDLLMIETIFDTLNGKAAIAAALDVAPHIPRWISFTAIDASGRNLSGQTVEAFWLSVEHADPLIVGVNCSLGAAEMRPYVESLSRVSTAYVACHPNAGPAERARSARRAARGHGPPPPRVRPQRARQRRRRLLRDDARPRHGDPGRGRRGGVRARTPPTRHAAAAGAALLGPGAVRDRARHGLRDDRRADERHRLGAGSGG